MYCIVKYLSRVWYVFMQPCSQEYSINVGNMFALLSRNYTTIGSHLFEYMIGMHVIQETRYSVLHAYSSCDSAKNADRKASTLPLCRCSSRWWQSSNPNLSKHPLALDMNTNTASPSRFIYCGKEHTSCKFVSSKSSA